MSAGRVPPHDLDAEASVLAAIMLVKDALDRVIEILQPEHFYSDANGTIYDAARLLAIAGQPVDLTTVTTQLRDSGKLKAAGNYSYLVQIVEEAGAVANVAAYAKTIRSKWKRRQVIARCQLSAAEGYDDDGETDAYALRAEQRVYELTQEARIDHPERVSPLLDAAMNRVIEAAKSGSRIVGTATGYERLDAKIAGLHRKDLAIVAARPGMGKTSLVLGMATNIASPAVGEKEATRGVLVCSLEMPKDQLALRLACSEGRVDLGKIRQGFMQPDDWRRLTEAAQYTRQLPIWIDDTPALSTLELRAKIRRVQREWERAADKEKEFPERRLAVVAVDYIQLMRGSGETDNREQEIAEISRGLKAIAKEFDVAVVALSQLNRAVETRSQKDKRPQLSDLRESGAIEQDADVIIFIYRDEYYFPEKTNLKGIAELIVAKQRNGPTGKVLVRFAASCTRFDNLAPGDYPELTDDD